MTHTPEDRIYTDGYHVCPGDDRGWPGFTERKLKDGRCIQVRGSDKAARKALEAIDG